MITPDRSHGRMRPRTTPRWAVPYLCVTALFLPLVYSTATIDPVLPPGFLVVACLWIVLATAFLAAIVGSKVILVLSRAEAIVAASLAAFIVIAAVSVLVTRPTPDAYFELLKLAALLWLILATSRAIHGESRNVMLLAKLVTLSSFAVGGFAVLQYYQIAIFDWMKVDTTVDSTLGHRNLLASFIALALPFVAYGFLAGHGRWRVTGAVTLLLSVFLLVVLQTRAVWVASPAGLAFSLCVLLAGMKRAPLDDGKQAMCRPRMVQAAGLTALGLTLALVCYSSPASRAPMGRHAGSLVELGDASIHERLELWSRTIRMIRDHPLTGVGLGNWRRAIPAYEGAGLRSDTGTLHFQRPHNDLLWVASETGLPGGILYVAMFVSILVLGVQAIVRARSAHDRLVLTLMLWGVSSHVLDSLFSFPKERITHLAYLALLTGTLISFHTSPGGKPAAVPFSRRWTTAIALLAWMAALITGQYAWSRYRAEVHLRRALEARAAKHWPQMAAELDRIDTRFYDMDPTAAPVVWYRGVARFQMGDQAAALDDFRAALAVHPNHVHVLNNMATCQTLRGETEDALHNYRRAIGIAPRFEDARTNLGLLLHSLGRDQEALEVLTPIAADAVSPRFTECLGEVRAALAARK